MLLTLLLTLIVLQPFACLVYLCSEEEQASYHLWAEFGRRMGITDIPDSFDAINQWYTDFEAKEMRFHPDNAKLLHQTIDNALDDVPYAFCRGPLKSMLMWLLPAFLGERASVALGMQPPSRMLIAAIQGSLNLRKYILRYVMMPRIYPKVTTVSPKNGTLFAPLVLLILRFRVA
jgi:hypothetical protein